MARQSEGSKFEGRDSKGKFVKGNSCAVGNKGGRPPEFMSFREQAQIRASNNPELVQETLTTLITIATNPEHPKCIDAADKLIKLLGNYDPVETRSEIVGSVQVDKKSPLSELTKEDLLKLINRTR